ncbi:hypothetical protein [Methanorbis furvi]|uniref:Uncharacterized protein n=1 Tax=Methanorbis furvi TaxID=3028299 RepID=A0AAE4M9X7_9EURY|nr:hypothetical protein [Methanocorpusculaceae archaeon Ag1]
MKKVFVALLLLCICMMSAAGCVYPQQQSEVIEKIVYVYQTPEPTPVPTVSRVADLELAEIDYWDYPVGDSMTCYVYKVNIYNPSHVTARNIDVYCYMYLEGRDVILDSSTYHIDYLNPGYLQEITFKLEGGKGVKYDFEYRWFWD